MTYLGLFPCARVLSACVAVLRLPVVVIRSADPCLHHLPRRPVLGHLSPFGPALVNASEVHAAGLSATPVIHQTPMKGSAGHETSVPTTPTSFSPQNADFEPIAMELMIKLRCWKEQ